MTRARVRRADAGRRAASKPMLARRVASSAAQRAARAATLAALGLLALAPAAVRADDAPIRLVSATAQEQADAASAPAISADGRYVAFQGSLGGTRGIFRKDLLTGDVEVVVGGSAYAPGAPGADASAPSISGDGRYVSFTTSTPLDPADDPGSGMSVYVRDMTVAPPAGGTCAADPCADELASARDGSAAGLTYGAAPSGSGIPTGALASGRVALSADGRRVAFVTTGASDLASGAGDTSTPAGQVAVRDLDTDRTLLVSAQRDPTSGAMTDPPQPVPGGAVPVQKPGAALSADGTTVAWLGAHLPAQVPLLSDEAQAIAGDDAGNAPYDEPLWRRIADGLSAPTRRIVGGGDPLAPGCAPAGTLQDAACQGPFPNIAGNTFLRDSYTGWFGLPGDGVPQLSADGRTVALIGDPDGVSNVFLVDMHDGLTRQQAVRALTREVPLQAPEKANQPTQIPGDGDVRDVAISPDGRRVAFATARNQFPLAPPNLISPPLAQLGLLELYRVDLDAGTLERVTVAPGGAPSLAAGLLPQNGAGAASPSFSADDSVLAFGSDASNLVAGDANGASDAFAVQDLSQTDVPAAIAISPAPPAFAARPLWRIAASAASLRDGRVQLAVVVPGAGTLRARASAVLRLTVRVRRGRRYVLRTRLATRAVASVSRRTHHDGLVTLTLALAHRYLAPAAGGLDATVAVSFSGHGGTPLRDQLDVRFRIPRARRASARATRGRRR